VAWEPPCRGGVFSFQLAVFSFCGGAPDLVSGDRNRLCPTATRQQPHATRDPLLLAPPLDFSTINNTILA
jgi:hypothetical protein